MKKKVLIVTMIVAILVMALAGAVSAQSTTVTLTLKDHEGNGVAGGRASYYTSGWTSCPGVTDENGHLDCNVSANYNQMQMRINGTAKTISRTDLEANGHAWVIAEVVVELRDSSGDLILAPNENSGLSVGLHPSAGFIDKGRTGTDGKLTLYLFPTGDNDPQIKFVVSYRGFPVTRDNVEIAAGTQTIVFQTAKVQLFHSGSISYYVSGHATFQKPSMELLPGTYKFYFSNYKPADIVVPPEGISKMVNVILLKDSTGAGLADGKARGGFGNSYSSWHVAGSTDSNGVLFDIRDRTTPPGNMSYEMRINNTTQVKTQNAGTASVYKFKTVLLTLKLETCGAVPLSGGKARYGSSGTNYHFPGGGTSASGETSMQVLPGGQTSFEMGYNGTTQLHPNNPFTIPTSDWTVSWQTTKVEVTWPGHIAYGGSGDSAHFKTTTETPPTPVVTASKELMPGTTNFHFRPTGGHPGYYRAITYSGCYHHAGYMTLIDELGTPMANLSYPDTPSNLQWKRQCNGSWGSNHTWYASTDAHGMFPFDLTCTNWGKLTMGLNQREISYPNRAALAAMHYTWQAAKVNVELVDVDGVTPVAGGTVKQKASYNYEHGETDTNGHFAFYTFPTNTGTIQVWMEYNGTTEIKNQSIVAYPTVQPNNVFTFQLGSVTVGECTNNPAGSLVIRRGGSHGGHFYTGDVIKLMPGTYKYEGTCVGLSQAQAQPFTLAAGENLIIPAPPTAPTGTSTD